MEENEENKWFTPQELAHRAQYTWNKTNCFSSITEFDMDELRDPNGFITGPVVDEMIRYELRKAKIAKHPPLWAFETLVVSHNFWDRIENPMLHTVEMPPGYNPVNEFRGHFKDPWFYKRILIPCYLNHGHWVLVNWEFPRAHLAHMTKRKKIKGWTVWRTHVKIYDSCHGDLSRVWDDISNFFIEGDMNVDKFFKMGAPKDPEIHASIDEVPTQRDHNNCGFYVMHMAKSIIFGKNPKARYHVERREDDPHSLRRTKQLIAAKRERKYNRMKY
jgi:hypothetical protein